MTEHEEKVIEEMRRANKLQAFYLFVFSFSFLMHAIVTYKKS